MDRDLLDNDRHPSIDSDVENKSETTDATSGESEEEADSNRDPKIVMERVMTKKVITVMFAISRKTTRTKIQTGIQIKSFRTMGAKCASMDNMDELGYADL